jgi:hypothetical protein
MSTPSYDLKVTECFRKGIYNTVALAKASLTGLGDDMRAYVRRWRNEPRERHPPGYIMLGSRICSVCPRPTAIMMTELGRLGRRSHARHSENGAEKRSVWLRATISSVAGISKRMPCSTSRKDTGKASSPGSAERRVGSESRCRRYERKPSARISAVSSSRSPSNRAPGGGS